MTNLATEETMTDEQRVMDALRDAIEWGKNELPLFPDHLQEKTLRIKVQQLTAQFMEWKKQQ